MSKAELALPKWMEEFYPNGTPAPIPDTEAEVTPIDGADSIDRRLTKIGPVPADWLDPLNPPPHRQQLLTLNDGADFLPLGRVGILAAEGGAGKTQALCQLAVSVATGKPWFSEFQVETPGRVVLLLAEEDELEVRHRIHTAVAEMGLYADTERQALADLQRDLTCAWLMGEDVAMIQSDGPRYQAASVTTTDWVDVLRNHLISLGDLSLVILDPLARWGGPGVETDNNTATKLVEVAETIAQLPGNPTVLIASHVAKGTRDSPTKTPRGSSALYDGARWVATLTDNSTGAIFTVTKSNASARPAPVQLSRGRGGFLHFEGFADKSGAVPLDRQILEALEDGPKTMKKLREATRRNDKDISASVSRLAASGAVEPFEVGSWTQYRLRTVSE